MWHVTHFTYSTFQQPPNFCVTPPEISTIPRKIRLFLRSWGGRERILVTAWRFDKRLRDAWHRTIFDIDRGVRDAWLSNWNCFPIDESLRCGPIPSRMSMASVPVCDMELFRDLRKKKILIKKFFSVLQQMAVPRARTKKWLFWAFFYSRDRFAHILMSIAWIEIEFS